MYSVESNRLRHKRRRSASRLSFSSSMSITNSDSSLSPYNDDLGYKQICSCGVCGKTYKHRSCLVKHLWEHHEAWNTCLKYNLSKHQQVKMMEAAQTLVSLMYFKL
ncbi:hypothetical protein BB560_000274 [Smittium megazygosporum]|uniref:C2H2-type domain-containing protein n=1 Tax=Smittium megazygosporum TaxID=133381 RepID=A0A2T9ZKU5_9FUNG|nr:hypothetical protein BB560_000274 [Smittium megazygosporum]